MISDNSCTALAELIRARYPSAHLKLNEPMSLHTSFRIGGPADIWCAPECADDLRGILALAAASGVPVTIKGNGTNLLVRDAGIRGLVLETTRLDRLEIHEDGTIEADCGLLLSRLSTAARDACLTGLEFAQGIPGTVGGAVYMNAGAYDGEMSRFVASSEWISEDGRSGVVAGSAHDFGYRRSIYSQKPGLYVLKATLRLSPGSKADITAKMADYRARRQASQPLDMPSAGSVFKRPEGHYTGKLISDLGLKGYAIGGAQISEKHAGFIINTGGATCADVLALIDYICTEVDKAYGVRLEREVKVIGG